MTRRIILFAAVVLAVCAGTASAATYYVDCDDPAANDSHTKEEAQSEAKPWKTLYSAGFHAQPGDTVLVKDGVCPDPEDVYGDKRQAAYFAQDGESARKEGKPYWTTFKAYPGHHPNIRFKLPKVGINLTESSYILIDGLEISPEDYQKVNYCGGHNIWIGRGHHIVIRNCNVHGSPVGGIAAAWADYLTIENNTVWDNCKWSSSNSSGIHIYQPHASNVAFGETTVNGTDYRIVIANNRIYDNEATLPPDQVCFPWLSGPFPSWPVDGNGIALDDFGNSQVYEDSPDWMKEHKDKLYPHRTLIMNNLTYGNGGRGILVGGGHVDILHNTAYGNMQNNELRNSCGGSQDCNLFGEIAVDGPDMKIFNNIAVAEHTRTLSVKLLSDWSKIIGADLSQKVVYGNNLTYGGWGIEDNGSIGSNAGNNIVQDPLLAAPGLNADSDFHLTQDSPAINKGSAENSVPLDFDGFARPIGILPDIGAYEAMSDTAKTVNPANGHSYQRFNSPLTWSEAKAACAALGGYLATVTSPEEQKYVTSKGANAWLGATDEVQEGTWKWITGEPCNWTNWNSGEPNECDGGEDFLQLWPNGTWNDSGGPGGGKDTALPYICEWNGSSSAPWLPAMYQFLLKGK